MKFLLVISLVGAAVANPLSLDNEDAVNDMLDMVDSSLESEPEGRALWVSITLTATSTSLSTASVTTTVTDSCWTTTAALSNCTTATGRRRSMSNFESLVTEGLTVERDGMKVDPLTIMPSKPTQASQQSWHLSQLSSLSKSFYRFLSRRGRISRSSTWMASSYLSPSCRAGR